MREALCRAMSSMSKGSSRLVTAYSLTGECLRVARIYIDDIAGRFRRCVGRQEIYRLGDVLRQHVLFEQRSLSIELLQLVPGINSIRAGAFLTPFAVPNPRASNHGIGIHHIDPNSRFGAFQCQATR